MNFGSQTVYMDTSAWNGLCDWVTSRSRKWIEGPEYLFSSCNLDEFSLAPIHRAKELAVFAWRTSNRQKLLDHLELTVAEITAFQKGTKLDYIEPSRRRLPYCVARHAHQRNYDGDACRFDCANGGSEILLP